MNPACLIALSFLLISGTGLEERIKSFHEDLKFKEIDSYSTRQSLRGYFLSDDDLSNFIVVFVQRIQDEGFRARKVNEWGVEHLEEHEAEARADIRIIGKGFLFFKASFIFKEEWVNRDGKWFIVPPRGHSNAEVNHVEGSLYAFHFFCLASPRDSVWTNRRGDHK
jgi:hypothetical protein